MCSRICIGEKRNEASVNPLLSSSFSAVTFWRGERPLGREVGTFAESSDEEPVQPGRERGASTGGHGGIHGN